MNCSSVEISIWKANRLQQNYQPTNLKIGVSTIGVLAGVVENGLELNRQSLILLNSSSVGY
jgi:hypothetical protein